MSPISAKALDTFDTQIKVIIIIIIIIPLPALFWQKTSDAFSKGKDPSQIPPA